MKSLIILLLILLVPYASALEITEFEFYSHGTPITAVSNGKVPNIDLKIVVSGAGFTSLAVDISSLNSNEAVVSSNNYANKMVGVSDCDFADDVYTCFIRGIELMLTDATVTIPLTLNAGSTSETIDKTYTFTIDNTKPEITFIGTDRCIDETCYFASGRYNEIVMEFQDSQATFEKKLVRFSLAGRKHFIYKCDGMTCYGRAKETCVSGQMLPLKILPLLTMDDAYNRLSNSMRTDILCDGEAPEVLATKIESSTAEYVKVGDIMIVTVNVSEDMGPVFGTGNFSEFGGDVVEATCEEKEENWECVFSTTVVGSDPYTAKAEITISDFAGNEFTYTTEPVDVLGLLEDEEPDYWTISYEYSPEIINKQMVPYVQKKVYMHTTLTSRASNIEVLRTWVTDCQAEGGQTYMSSQGPEMFNYEIGSKNPVIVFSLLRTELPEELEKLKFNCTLNIQTRKDTNVGKFLISQPEREVINLEIELANPKSPDQQIKEEVSRVMNKSETWNEATSSYYSFMSTTKTICEGLNTLNVASGTLSGAAEVFNKAGQVEIAKPLTKSALVVGIAPESAFSVPNVQGACKFLTCEQKWQTAITDNMGDWWGMEELAQFAGYDSYTEFVNPDNSMVMSLATGCIPSFLYNLQKLKAVDCEYLQCLSVDVAGGGLPVSQCGRIRAEANCKYWIGEVFEVFPYTAILEDTTRLMKETFSNPVNMLGPALSLACSIDKVGDSMKNVCNIAASVSKVTSFFRSFGSIGDTARKYSEPVSACDNILNSIDSQTLRNVNIQPAKSYSIGDANLGCGISGCENNNYVAVRHGDSFIYYKKDGKGYNYVDESAVPEKDKNTFKNNYNQWKQEYEKNIPPNVKTAYDNYGDALADSNSKYDSYTNAQMAYNEYKEDYDNLKNANRRFDIRRSLGLPTENVATEVNKAKQKLDETINNLKEKGIEIKDDASYDKIVNDLKKDAKTARTNYNTAAGKTKSELREALKLALYTANWEATAETGEGWNEWSTSLNIIRGVNYATSFLVPDEAFASWREHVDRLFHNVVMDSEYRKSKICEAYFAPKFENSPDIALTFTGRVGFSTGAHIQGERTELIEDELGNELITYTISTYVAPKKPGLDFVIKLYPGGEIIFRNETTEEIPLFALVEDNVLIYESSDLYNRVCLEFSGNWKDYFDLVHSDVDNTLCNSITEVGS
ncbi:MAG: hypothetical protein ABH828_04505 [archaeon]